jgi:hypothetical protein
MNNFSALRKPILGIGSGASLMLFGSMFPFEVFNGGGQLSTSVTGMALGSSDLIGGSSVPKALSSLLVFGTIVIATGCAISLFNSRVSNEAAVIILVAAFLEIVDLLAIWSFLNSDISNYGRFNEVTLGSGFFVSVVGCLVMVVSAFVTVKILKPRGDKKIYL